MALQTSQPRKALSRIPSQVLMVSTRQNVGGLKFPRLIAAYIGLLAGKLVHVVLFCMYLYWSKNGDTLLGMGAKTLGSSVGDPFAPLPPPPPHPPTPQLAYILTFIPDTASRYLDRVQVYWLNFKRDGVKPTSKTFPPQFEYTTSKPLSRSRTASYLSRVFVCVTLDGLFNNYSTSLRWVWVGCNHLISDKREGIILFY